MDEREEGYTKWTVGTDRVRVSMRCGESQNLPKRTNEQASGDKNGRMFSYPDLEQKQIIRSVSSEAQTNHPTNLPIANEGRSMQQSPR